MGTRFLLHLLAAANLAVAGPAAHAADAAAPARPVLTLAEQPVRLIRGAVLYKAAAGVAVQKDDILETDAAGAQVEAGPGSILALGPHTRVFVTGLAADDKSATEIALLDGWVKVLARTNKRALVVTPALQVTLASGSAIVHTGDGKDAVFAESGEQQAARVDAKGKPGAPVKLPAEQYAAVDPEKAQPTIGRPPRDFVTAMPAAFRDGLQPAPRAAHAGKVAPVKEREVDFADVDAWLGAPLPVRAGFVARFRPRLADPGFRKPLDAAFGQSAEWKPVLHPPPALHPALHP